MVRMAQTSVPKVLGYVIQNLKSTKQTLFITKVPSDCWPLYFWHLTKRELAGVGDVASDHQPGLCLHTVLFTHFLTHARDCAFHSCLGSTRCDKSQGCILPVTLSCEHGKHWSLFPLSELCLCFPSFPQMCVNCSREFAQQFSLLFFAWSKTSKLKWIQENAVIDEK